MSFDYEWVEFYPIPSQALTYIITAEERLPLLVEPEDWPEIDIDFQDLLWRMTADDLLPKVGLQVISQNMKQKLDDRLDEFLSIHGEQPVNRVLVFADVWNTPHGIGTRFFRHSNQVTSS